MSTELSAVIGAAVGGGVALAATPLAMRAAVLTDFLDHPREYRKHAFATPLLGGAAVLAGVLVAAVATGAASGRLLVLLACAVGLWLLGTIDDRVDVSPVWRLLAEVSAAVALFVGGLGWEIGRADGVEVVLTVIWVVGIVNAFNLMDNLDGACATVACVSGAGIGTLATIHAQASIAGLAFALSGACAAFLTYNLRRPSRIFLGDGGSMVVGFLVAGLAMATARHLYFSKTSLLTCALLVGLPILDTTLVSVSRLRRGVTLLTGGRDHLTHRLLGRLGSPQAVALCLALAQAVLCGAAVWGDRAGDPAVYLIASVAVVLGVAAIAILDSPRWRPAGIVVEPGDLAPGTPERELESVGIDSP